VEITLKIWGWILGFAAEPVPDEEPPQDAIGFRVDQDPDEDEEADAG
jgi:hypothetical protein